MSSNYTVIISDVFKNNPFDIYRYKTKWANEMEKVQKSDRQCFQEMSRNRWILLFKFDPMTKLSLFCSA